MSKCQEASPSCTIGGPDHICSDGKCYSQSGCPTGTWLVSNGTCTCSSACNGTSTSYLQVKIENWKKTYLSIPKAKSLEEILSNLKYLIIFNRFQDMKLIFIDDLPKNEISWRSVSMRNLLIFFGISHEDLLFSSQNHHEIFKGNQ